jgi:hypothetical protein
MQTPAPVSVLGQDISFSSESTLGNYIRGEMDFSSGYEDNIFGSASDSEVPDVNYVVRPAFSLYRSTSRLLLKSFYAPRFIIYQRHSELDRTDHDLQLQMTYRLTPHVTIAFQDSFAKTASQLFGVEQNTISPIGTTHAPVATVVSPQADLITNDGSAQIAYQFRPNAMVGASGSASRLHHLDPSQFPGLFDSHAQAARAFYSHRFASRHYVGARYEYQYLISAPTGAGEDVQTQTHSTVLFYTMYLNPRTSVSVFAGPQHADTHGGAFTPLDSWYPTYGGDFSWQGELTSVGLSAGESVSAGGGLQAAVRSVSGSASFRRQLTKTMNVGMSAHYSHNTVLEIAPEFNNSGHTTSGSVSLHRQFRDNLEVQIAYTHFRQNYSNTTTPLQNLQQNRVSLSLSYHFEKPIGR